MQHVSQGTLASLPQGSTAIVASFAADASDREIARLNDLGITIGTEITTVRRAPMLDPTIYRFRGVSLCLRSSQTSNILVEDVVVACREHHSGERSPSEHHADGHRDRTRGGDRAQVGA